MQRKQTKSAWLVWVGILLAGCAASTPKAEFDGPSDPVDYHVEDWKYPVGLKPKTLKTPHYNINTTIDTADVQQSIVQVMEGALTEYQKIAPGVPLTDKPMECFIFANRGQWIDFTRKHTGPDANVYLQINRGGYTIRDWYVAYYVGEAATYSVAAHEGWHQFVSRHFKGRLPPFLEEGIATMFEDVTWKDELPRWNLARNRSRVQALRRAVEGNFLFPLVDVVGMHAGNVVNQSGNRIEAFYAEAWAFATFLYGGEDGKYRPALRKLMSDISDGSVVDPTGVFKDANAGWNPVGVKPMLEHYLGVRLEQLDGEYQQYIRRVAFDEYASQWNE